MSLPSVSPARHPLSAVLARCLSSGLVVLAGLSTRLGLAQAAPPESAPGALSPLVVTADLWASPLARIPAAGMLAMTMSCPEA